MSTDNLYYHTQKVPSSHVSDGTNTSAVPVWNITNSWQPIGKPLVQYDYDEEINQRLHALQESGKSNSTVDATSHQHVAQSGYADRPNTNFEEILAKSTNTASAAKTRTLKEIVALADDEPYTFMTADEVDNWFTTTNDVSTKATSYYRSTGWKAPNTEFTTSIDDQLGKASKVRQYFLADKSRLQNPDTTLREFDAY